MVLDWFKKMGSVQICLQQSAEITTHLAQYTVLFGVLEKENFLNTVVCYVRLHSMNSKV